MSTLKESLMHTIILAPGVETIPKDFSGSVSYQGTWLKYTNGKIHHNTEPSIVLNDGTKMWFFQGELHRANAPAIIWGDGSIEYIEYGLFHRLNGPARIIFGEDTSVQKEWWCRGQLHRDKDLPAIIHSNGYKEWWNYHKLHNAYGPAIEHCNGNKEWFLCGKPYSKEEFQQYQADTQFSYGAHYAGL